MLSIEPLLGHVIPFLLVVSRIGGLFMFAPVIAGSTVPARVRVGIVLMLSASVYPFTPEFQTAPPLHLVTLAPLIITEIMLGGIIGLIAGLPLVMLDLAGFMMGHKMGLGLARVINPEIDGEADIVGQMVFYIGLSAFFMMGGIDMMFVSLLRTFESVPMGGYEVTAVPLGMLLGVLSSGMEMATRLSLPVLAVLFLETLAAGLLMKTMPQINILSVGFAIKIMAGLLILLFSLGAIAQVTYDEIESVLLILLDWSAKPM